MSKEYYDQEIPKLEAIVSQVIGTSTYLVEGGLTSDQEDVNAHTGDRSESFIPGEYMEARDRVLQALEPLNRLFSVLNAKPPHVPSFEGADQFLARQLTAMSDLNAHKV